MSKIYDALRRVEREKRKAKSKKKGRIPPKDRITVRGRRQMGGVNENFRRSLLTLRNSIDSEMRQRDTRVIIFTSAVRGEGKTTIISSLARMMALSETEKILLVDCSIMNPELHKLFGAKNEKGIIEYLAGDTELSEVIHSLDQGVLDLVPAGSVGGSDVTQPLFNSDRMRHFVKEVAEEYDYVLIDTSAVLEAPETAIIGSYAGGVVMVIHAGKTRREVIKRAMLMIEKMDGRFIGTILNKKKYYIPEFIYRRV